MTAGYQTDDDDDESRPSSAGNTVFDFTFKLFTVPGANFSLAGDGEPVLNIQLGDMRASLPFETIRASFDLKDYPHDVELLELVERSLEFVKVIRPGEAIPGELLDGSASWTVEERHRQIARGRLVAQMIAWLDGKEPPKLDLFQFQRVEDDQGNRTRYQEALDAVTAKLGLPPERKPEIAGRVDQLAQELSYIEALRERFGKVREIAKLLTQLAQVYRSESDITADISRVRVLLRKPLQEFEHQFDHVEAQTGEILGTLRNYLTQVKFIRQVRDEVHIGLLDWDEVIRAWHNIGVGRSVSAEAAIKQTYRFAASRFIEAQVWRRGS